MPSLKEKKRYLAVELFSDKPLDFAELEASIQEAFNELAGSLGAGTAGLSMVHKFSNSKKKRALLRVHKDYLNLLRSSLLFVQFVNDDEAMVHSIGASGMLNKAYKKYIAA